MGAAMPTTPTPEAAHYAALDQRVTGLEGAVKDIASGVRDLGTKLDNNSKTPWPTIISLAGVAVAILVAIGGLAYRPIDAAQSRLESELKIVQLQIVPRGEHTEHWRRDEKDVDHLRHRIEKLEDRERRSP